jgi:hypothetical protein
MNADPIQRERKSRRYKERKGSSREESERIFEDGAVRLYSMRDLQS